MSRSEVGLREFMPQKLLISPRSKVARPDRRFAVEGNSTANLSLGSGLCNQDTRFLEDSRTLMPMIFKHFNPGPVI